MSDLRERLEARSGRGAARRLELATFITVEYAASDEDSGFYVNFGHIF